MTSYRINAYCPKGHLVTLRARGAGDWLDVLGPEGGCETCRVVSEPSERFLRRERRRLERALKKGKLGRLT